MDSLKDKLYISLVLLIVVITYIIFIFNKNSNNQTKLDEVKLKTEINEISKNGFAIMIEKEDGTGYEEVDEFPEGLPLNTELTGCIDIDGKSLENALSYDNGVVTVNVNSTAYCYLYFDTKLTFGNQLLKNPTTGLNSSMQGGLYRYQGAGGTVDNYICFGTSDKDICLSNTDAYIYRIIGITEDGKIKVIKNEALNSGMVWYSSGKENITWPDSTVYSNINGSSFLTNTSYMLNDWKDKIEDKTWKYGDHTVYNVTAEELYNIENSWIDTVDAKIGLIYAHDYAYAYKSGGLNCETSASTCKKSWLHLGVSDPGAPDGAEWTMSRYGINDSNYYIAWVADSSGYIIRREIYYSKSVRPVFFLKLSVEFIGGTGKSDDPFIIQ